MSPQDSRPSRLAGLRVQRPARARPVGLPRGAGLSRFGSTWRPGRTALPLGRHLGFRGVLEEGRPGGRGPRSLRPGGRRRPHAPGRRKRGPARSGRRHRAEAASWRTLGRRAQGGRVTGRRRRESSPHGGEPARGPWPTSLPGRRVRRGLRQGRCPWTGLSHGGRGIDTAPEPPAQWRYRSKELCSSMLKTRFSVSDKEARCKIIEDSPSPGKISNSVDHRLTMGEQLFS